MLEAFGLFYAAGSLVSFLAAVGAMVFTRDSSEEEPLRVYTPRGQGYFSDPDRKGICSMSGPATKPTTRRASTVAEAMRDDS